MYSYSTRSLNNLKGVHPDVVKVFMEAIKESPYDFIITWGLRTAQQQYSLWCQGRTVKGKKYPGIVVTGCDGYARKSNHQMKKDGYGHAVDIVLCGHKDANGKYVKYTTTKEMYDDKKMREMGAYIKGVAYKLGIPIEWGGDWKKPYDPPHFQLKSSLGYK